MCVIRARLGRETPLSPYKEMVGPVDKKLNESESIG